MDTYVCEVRINDDELVVVNVKAMTRLQVKRNCRDALRKLGYKITLKDIHVMYIDNSRPAINDTLRVDDK